MMVVTDTTLNRFSFSKIFADAWMKSMTMNNITGGFKVTGIYPPNRHALLSEQSYRVYMLTLHLLKAMD